MATVTFKGTPCQTSGEIPKVGSLTPNFQATTVDLIDTSLMDFMGKKIILNIFPSLDTSVCSLSVKQFNEYASSLPNTIILCLSADLPFAQKRFCSIEKLDKIVPLSIFRYPSFGAMFGIMLINGPLKGLLSRSIFVIDESGKVIYNELVSEITEEPNYQKAIEALNPKD